MLTEFLNIALPLAAGITLGVMFFGGLYWTIRKGLASNTPAFWFLGSLVVRTSLVAAGFYFVSGGHWQRLLLCLLGSALGRLAVTYRVRKSGEDSPSGAGGPPCDLVPTS